MGVLRLVLAVGVVLEHSGTPLFAGSYTAVQAFFMISGFYMSLIYKNYGGKRDFYKSRFFRLFPAYWAALLLVALAATIFAALGRPTPATNVMTRLGELPAAHRVWVIGANWLIFGSDWAWFMNQTPIGTPTFNLLIPPIWTVSLELMFYALVPILAAARTRALLGVAVFLVVARVTGYVVGFDADPWHARFFPFELPLFVLGIIAERMRLGTTAAPPAVKAFSIASVFLLSACFYPISAAVPSPTIYGQGDFVASLLLYGLLFTALPHLFEWTKSSKADREIGDYSYLVYISHYIFVEGLIHAGALSGLAGTAAVVVLSFAQAAALKRIVQQPADRFRRRFGRSGVEHARAESQASLERSSASPFA